jgi:hypothetical protein
MTPQQLFQAFRPALTDCVNRIRARHKADLDDWRRVFEPTLSALACIAAGNSNTQSTEIRAAIARQIGRMEVASAVDDVCLQETVSAIYSAAYSVDEAYRASRQLELAREMNRVTRDPQRPAIRSWQ